MIFIFYDFETSSKSVLGQILSYSFIATTSHLEPIEECNGLIQLNRLQLPEVGAILTNRLQLKTVQENGSSEYESAKHIHRFLTTFIFQHGSATLVGFNSNRFDLSWLRTLFTRYGLDPYFKGKLKNLDILHFTQYLAFQHPEEFPWVQDRGDRGPFYSFTLENTASSFGLLTEAQSHDAREDVLLTIALTHSLSSTFHTSLSAFEPFSIPDSFVPFKSIGLEKTRHFPGLSEEPLQKVVETPYLFLSQSGKNSLWIDLEKAKTLMATTPDPSENEWLSVVTYRNPNKHFFILTALPLLEMPAFQTLLDRLETVSLLQHLQQKPEHYFNLTEKDWDIDYLPHRLGFDRLPKLHELVKTLIQSPDSYTETLQTLLMNRSCQADTDLIRLYNRVYLNYHPNPDPAAIQKYVGPRYLTGTLYKSLTDFTSFDASFQEIEDRLNDTNCPDSDVPLLLDLKAVYTQFKALYLT